MKSLSLVFKKLPLFNKKSILDDEFGIEQFKILIKDILTNEIKVDSLLISWSFIESNFAYDIYNLPRFNEIV